MGWAGLSRKQQEAAALYLSDTARLMSVAIIVVYVLFSLFSENGMGDPKTMYVLLGFSGVFLILGGYIRVKYTKVHDG